MAEKGHGSEQQSRGNKRRGEKRGEQEGAEQKLNPLSNKIGRKLIHRQGSGLDAEGADNPLHPSNISFIRRFFDRFRDKDRRRDKKPYRRRHRLSNIVERDRD
jgi:hypothetical protein